MIITRTASHPSLFHMRLISDHLQVWQRFTDGLAFSAAYIGSDYYWYKRESKYTKSTVWRDYFQYREQKAQRQLET